MHLGTNGTDGKCSTIQAPPQGCGDGCFSRITVAGVRHVAPPTPPPARWWTSARPWTGVGIASKRAFN